MKRWILPLAAFLLAGILAHLVTRSQLSGAASTAATARARVAPTRQSPPASASAKTIAELLPLPADNSYAQMIQHYFSDCPGPENEAARLKRIARLANVGELNDNGELMPALVELLGLTEVQARNAQESLDKARERMSQELKSRMVVTNETSPEKIAEVEEQLGKLGRQQQPTLLKMEHFDIPADPDTGGAIMTDLQRDLTASAGPVAADVILDDGRLGERFGAFGNYPIHGDIKQFSADGRNEQTIDYEILNNEGKLFQRTGSTQAASVRARLGSVLDGHYLEDAP